MPELGEIHPAYKNLAENENVTIEHRGHKLVAGQCIGENAGLACGIPGVIISAVDSFAYWYDPLLLIPSRHSFIYAPFRADDPGNEGVWNPHKGSCWRTVARVPFDLEGFKRRA